MKTLGLTGGMGAGKSTVAQLFVQKDIPVFDSDTEAKLLYSTNPEVKAKVLQLLGPQAYVDDQPNTAYIGKKVFADAELLQQLNGIIHPALDLQFSNWKEDQTSPFVVKEAAILFESGAYKKCDAILTVTADIPIRMKRVMQRDQLSAEEVTLRMQRQWPERRKIELSDYVVYNNENFKALHKEFEEIYPEISFRLS